MAIPWLVVLKSVPWTEVIANAPKVADGARKLWGAVSGGTETAPPPAVDAPADASPEARRIAALAQRVASLEATNAELREQMLASSELIRALADQNAQLVARVEANRVRTVRLTIAVAVLAIFAASWLVVALARQGV